MQTLAEEIDLPGPPEEAGMEEDGLGEGEDAAPRRYVNEGEFEQGDPFHIPDIGDRVDNPVARSKESGGRFRRHVGTLAHPVPPPLPMREAWTGDTVRTALQAMERGKAPGLDE